MDKTNLMWVPVKLGRWTFEYAAYHTNSSYQGMDIVRGRIPEGGLVLRNVYHAGYRMAYSIGVNAIWISPGPKAQEEGYLESKKLVLGIPDFEQIEVGKEGSKNFEVVKYQKGVKGNRSGLPNNFWVFSNSIEGELIVKWKSKEKVFGPNSCYLYITQKFVFTKYSSVPAHEPTGGMNAGRIHPLTRYYYYSDHDEYLKDLRVDYRMHMNVDSNFDYVIHRDGQRPSHKYVKNHVKGFLNNYAGVFKDFDTLETGYPADRAVFESMEKPIVAEIVSDALYKGVPFWVNKKFEGPRYTGANHRTWDNIHWWGAGGYRHASTPGAFHAIHLHWRWGKILQEKSTLLKLAGIPNAGKPQFSGEGHRGILTDLASIEQGIKFGIIKNHDKLPEAHSDHSERVFEDFFTKLHSNGKPDEIARGSDLVLYYSCDVPIQLATITTTSFKPRKGYLFLHGVFFAHEMERGISKTVGSNFAQYVNPGPNRDDVAKDKWKRYPKIP